MELSLSQLRSLICDAKEESSSVKSDGPDNGMLGSYVIVRCRDAGVHAGTLEWHHGRECVLTDSQRLWYWKPKSGKYLSGVANNGLHVDSKISETLVRLHLTETCEIIECTNFARDIIRGLDVNT